MKAAGLALLVLGTIVASLGGARVPSIDRLTVAIGLVLVVAGAVVARVAARSAGGTASAAPVTDALDALRELAPRVRAVLADAEGTPLPALADRLSALKREAFDPLSERAPALLGAMSGDRFASVFGPYASAERAVGRAWSAASDGHAEEAIGSLRVAVERLDEAIAAAG